ncbi:MAG: PepSY-like domain-containing protein [Solitalea sp.]
MKTSYFIAGLLFTASAFTACSDDDSISPNNAAEEAFRAKYPEATGVKWERERAHYVAEFRLSQREAEAWFDANGTWKLTETDLLAEDLPGEVQAVLDAGEYGSWRIDDIDFIERPGQEPFYVIEVEQGEQEFDLYFLADGSLIKAFPDSDNDNDYLPQDLPSAVSQFLTENYPGYKLIDVDKDDGRIEVEFLDGNAKRDAAFSAEGTWLNTSTDIQASDVPQQISDVLAGSEYASYRIDDVDFVETPDGNYYDFDLESENNDVDVRIHEDGRLEVLPD